MTLISAACVVLKSGAITGATIVASNDVLNFRANANRHIANNVCV